MCPSPMSFMKPVGVFFATVRSCLSRFGIFAACHFVNILNHFVYVNLLNFEIEIIWIENH